MARRKVVTDTPVEEVKEVKVDDTTLFVQSLYSSMFGIDAPDKRSVAYYASRIKKGELSRKDCVKSFANSVSFLNRELSDGTVVAIMYSALNREGTPEEVTADLKYLESHTRADYINKVLSQTGWVSK